jgi:hypothetical protein
MSEKLSKAQLALLSAMDGGYSLCHMTRSGGVYLVNNDGKWIRRVRLSTLTALDESQHIYRGAPQGLLNVYFISDKGRDALERAS